MCYDEGNNVRPLGLNEAESAWLSQMSKYRDAMTNDVYSNGGLLDNTNKFGYTPVSPFNTGTIGRQILETEFSYEELSFISRCRLISMTLPDIDRLLSLIKRFKQSLEVKGLTVGQDTIGTPNYFIPQYNTNVQPLCGVPVPMEIPKEWKGETPSGISRRQMGTKEWDDHFASLSNDDVQKGPNEPDEQEEEMPSFLGAAWNNKPSNVRSSLYNGVPGAPEPGFKNKTSKSTTRVVLSAKEVSSKDDVQKGPNEPDETEDETEKKQKEFTEMVYESTSDTPGPAEPGYLMSGSSLKAILDYPSTGIKINENPVPLTEENKSVDKEEKNND